MTDITDEQIEKVLQAIGDSDRYVLGVYGRDIYIVPYQSPSDRMIEYVKGEINE